MRTFPPNWKMANAAATASRMRMKTRMRKRRAHMLRAVREAYPDCHRPRIEAAVQCVDAEKEGIRMSIFSKIKDAIFGHKPAAPTQPQPETAGASAAPATTQPPTFNPTPETVDVGAVL